MFRIGEFSRLGQVTINTLRHYDAVGLLKPAKVDPFTGYRIYAATQLRPLNRILALKELGFSLEEIIRIFQENLTNDQLRGMLKMQQILAESELQAAQSRLDRIMARLNYLDLEDNMPTYEVTLKPVETVTIAGIRELIPTIEQIDAHGFKMFERALTWINENGLPIGSPLTRYFNEQYVDKDIDMECAYIIPDIDIADVPTPDEPIKIHQLDAVPHMATTLVTGNFDNYTDGLTPAYRAIAEWIAANGYRMSGPPRGLYHSTVDKGDFVAEIQFPVEKV